MGLNVQTGEGSEGKKPGTTEGKSGGRVGRDERWERLPLQVPGVPEVLSL